MSTSTSSPPNGFGAAREIEATSDERAAVATTPVPKLYPVVWRWHFYAGLLTAPVLSALALTGAAYVFRTEIVAWRDHELQTVEPRGERLPFDRLLEHAVRHAGGEEIEAIAAYPKADRSVRFVSHEKAGGDRQPEQRHVDLYVDPYTGDLLGKRFEEEDVFSVILDLHRTLLLGSTGRVIAELATSWSVILLATGLYLWWPRGKRNVGVWVPRVGGKIYAILRDWHAVPGAYLAPLIGVVAFTGLFFSLVFGTAFNTSVQTAGHWPAKWFDPPQSAPVAPGTPPVALEGVVATFLQHAKPDDAALIRLASTPEGAHRAFLMRDEDKNSLRMVTVDQYTGKPIDLIAGNELPFLYRVRLWAVSIHMGQICGTPTKILALTASLTLFGLSFTGVWMWWRRRPRGRLGNPRRPASGTLPSWGWALIIAMAVMLPVAGVSMLIAGGLDFVVCRWRHRRAMAL